MEDKNIVPSVGVVAFNGNKTLLVRNEEKADHLTGTYGLAAGRLEEGESEIDAAYREFHEETGLIAESLIEFSDNTYFAAIERKSGEKVNFSFRVFICDVYTGEIHIVDEENTPEWVDVDQLDQLKLLPNIKDAVLKAREFLNENIEIKQELKHK
jgi:ADP-ribose pyrophosphatase YjhB (NUDIX family)